MKNPNIPFLDLISPHVALKEELLQSVSAALDTASFIGGPQVTQFETEFAAFVGTTHAVGLANGTDALRLALIAMNLPAGSKVITVPNSFIATTEAISQAGLAIDFVDIDPGTCLMDPQRLADSLKNSFEGSKNNWPTAIVPVHLYGQCADMDPILDLAAQFELQVLEDAAQAHGATYKGRKAGTMGRAAGFSFYPGKNLGACGDAGAITTNDAGIAETVSMLREHGQKSKYFHKYEGYNARLDAIQAGFLRVKLRHLEKWNAARAEAAAVYDAAFAGRPDVRVAQVAAHNNSCYHLYVIHVANRERLQDALKQHGIATALHYPLPLHLQECYSHLGYVKGSFANTEAAAKCMLSLPMFPELGADRARLVANAVLKLVD